MDVTDGWHDEASRLEFLRIADRIETKPQRCLSGRWDVEVSRSAGLTEVRLMGEYGCDWPLWTHDGLSDPEEWPMISAAVKERLRVWAAKAEPASEGRPDPGFTERLLRDLRAELGARFSVTSL